MNDPASFTPFGTTHLLTIAAILLVSVGLPLWLRRSGSAHLTRRLAVGLAVFGVLHELAKTWAWVVIWDQPLARSLPLEICGVAVFLTAVVLIWRWYRAYEVLYFWGLAGAVPEDAFSVHVGLGQTMTPQDILEGILRVTVLVAVSRPAEFIEITFQQQMQKS